MEKEEGHPSQPVDICVGNPREQRELAHLHRQWVSNHGAGVLHTQERGADPPDPGNQDRADQLLQFACRKWACEGGRGEAWRGEGKQEGVGSNKISMNSGSQSWRNH